MVEGILIILLLGAIAYFLLYIFYRAFRPDWVIADVLSAYHVAKLKKEIEKRGFDFDEMMREYFERAKFFKVKRSTKGVLQRIDKGIEDEVEEEPKKGKK